MGLLDKASKIKQGNNTLNDEIEIDSFIHDDHSTDDIKEKEMLHLNKDDLHEINESKEEVEEEIETENLISSSLDDAEEPVSEKEENIKEKEKNIVDDEIKVDDESSAITEDSQIDYMIFYEIEKEINKAKDKEELYDTLLFTIMGQIGISSASIMEVKSESETEWEIILSRGVKISGTELSFNSESGILGEVFQNKNIVDIDDYNLPKYKDEYYRYISVDARVIVPLITDGEIKVILLLGEKLTLDVYSNDENIFLMSIGEAVAVSLMKISLIEELKKENDKISIENKIFKDSDDFKNNLYKLSSLSSAILLVRETIKDIGADGFAIFNREKNDTEFRPIITEIEDFISITDNDFSIDYNTPFIKFLSKSNEIVEINDFENSTVIGEIFSEQQLNKMNIFIVYPCLINLKLIGFLLLYRKDENFDIEGINLKLSKISFFLNQYVYSLIDFDESSGKFYDNVDKSIKKVEFELQNACNLSIPLTIVLLSIKNYKRFYNLKGEKGVKELLTKLKMIIANKLSDNDFSIRYDRHKIYLILPGKDKKYAVPLVSSIKNEIIEVCSDDEIQLLITSLAAEYPVDGKDLHSLLNSIA